MCLCVSEIRAEERNAPAWREGHGDKEQEEERNEMEKVTGMKRIN